MEDNGVPYSSGGHIWGISESFKCFQVIANLDLVCRSCCGTDKAKQKGKVGVESHFRSVEARERKLYFETVQIAM